MPPFYEKRPYRRGPDLTDEYGEFEQMFAIALYCAKVHEIVKILCKCCAGS
jgi:hypothetical protein